MQPLFERTFHSDPIHQFRRWFRAAKLAGLHEPNAMMLATVSPAEQPSARMVLLKGVDPAGFVFFTNYDSRKGREMAANRRVALVFYWPSLHRQVRVTGRVAKVTAAESDAYFASRAAGSRVAAAASPQSRVIASRAALEARVHAVEEKYPDSTAPRPIHWGGYRVHPDEIEFWQQGEYRLHDRLRYRKIRAAWMLERLAP